MKSLIDEKTETLDDLLCGYKVIQPKKGFRFSIDAVLLSHFATVKNTDTAVDFCSGSGVVAFLIMAHNNPQKISCIEIQPQYCDLIKKSIEYNKLKDKIFCINGDIACAKEYLGRDTMDLVTCNPPYIKANTGKNSDDESENIARREVSITLEGAVKSASEVLKNRGRFAIVHLAERADELFYFMQKYKLPVKRARLVQPKAGQKPNLILAEGVKNASSTIEWLPALNVYTDGEYSEEILKIYGG